jgi:hypothetical protein
VEDVESEVNEVEKRAKPVFAASLQAHMNVLVLLEDAICEQSCWVYLIKCLMN